MDNSLNLTPVFGIGTGWIVMIVVIVLLIAAFVALSIYGKKLQAKQEESQSAMQEAAQSVSLLVIDKKRMKMTEAGLPPIVLEQTPKYMRGRKVPIVKAKIGPKIMSLLCDERVFEVIPVKKEVRATISGIYIMDVKGLRTNLEARKTKLKFTDKIRMKMDKMKEEEKQQSAGQKKKKKEK